MLVNSIGEEAQQSYAGLFRFTGIVFTNKHKNSELIF